MHKQICINFIFTFFLFYVHSANIALLLLLLLLLQIIYFFMPWSKGDCIALAFASS